MRLTPAQRDRAKRCAKYLGLPLTTLAQTALLEKLDAVEVRMKQEAEAKRPRGLGLTFAEDRPRPKSDPRPSAHPSPAAPWPELDRFLAYVLAAESDEERVRRIDAIAQILNESSATPKEAKEAAEALDARMKDALEQRRNDPLFGTLIPGLGEDEPE